MTNIETLMERLRRSSDNPVIEVWFKRTTTTGLRLLGCLLGSDENVFIPQEEEIIMQDVLLQKKWGDSANHSFHVSGLSKTNVSWLYHILRYADDAQIVTTE